MVRFKVYPTVDSDLTEVKLSPSTITHLIKMFFSVLAALRIAQLYSAGLGTGRSGIRILAWAGNCLLAKRYQGLFPLG